MNNSTPQLALFTSAPHDPTLEIPTGYCACGCGEKTAIAVRNEYRRGHIKGEPVRYVHGHNPRRGSYEKRFWSHVDKNGPIHPVLGTPCWDWQGCTDPMGYGRIHIGSGGQSFTTHRVAYELTYGPIPEGLIVCHHCDRPRCCNPAHHFLGSHSDNTADMVAKNRHSHGANHPGAKLTETQVIEARQLYAQGVRAAHLAKKYNVADGTMREALHHETWKHIP